MSYRNKPKNAGFTLIELIFVMIIMAIVAIVAIPKWTASSMNANYQAINVLNDIRYTQLLSMTTGQRYRWVKISATTYQIQNSVGTAIILSSGSTTQTLTNGVSFGTFTNLPNNLIAFDSQGIPYTTSTTPGTALSATATLPLTGATTFNIQMSPSTGYVVLT